METTKTETDAAPETGATAAPETETETDSAKAADGQTAAIGEVEAVPDGDAEEGAAADDDAEDDAWGYEEVASAAEPTARSGAAAIVTGAGAIVGAALALASVTGTWLSNVVSQRQGLIGQIKTASGTAKAQIAAGYGTPWHTIALVNGAFAIVALVISGGVLLAPASRVRASRGHWSQAVAWGGAVLALIGLLIALALWFDVFAGLPAVPATPATGG